MAFKIKRRVTPLDENQKRQRQIAIIAIFLSVALFFIGFQIGKNNTNENTTLAKQRWLQFHFYNKILIWLMIMQSFGLAAKSTLWVLN